MGAYDGKALTNLSVNIALWVLQVLLASAFFAHGWMFLFPPADLVEVMNSSINPSFRLFLGVAEVVAAVGLTVPGAVRIMPGLVPAAAAGLMIVMVGATVFHAIRAEYSSAVITAILFALLAVVAYVRWKVRPFSVRAS